jgi:hypothetical protein
MFAVFGLGMQEILLLGVIAILVAGVAVAVVLISRASAGSSTRMRALEEENRRLREELDRGRDRAV